MKNFRFFADDEATTSAPMFASQHQQLGIHERCWRAGAAESLTAEHIQIIIKTKTHRDAESHLIYESKMYEAMNGNAFALEWTGRIWLCSLACAFSAKTCTTRRLSFMCVIGAPFIFASFLLRRKRYKSLNELLFFLFRSDAIICVCVMSSSVIRLLQFFILEFNL